MEMSMVFVHVLVDLDKENIRDLDLRLKSPRGRFRSMPHSRMSLPSAAGAISNQYDLLDRDTGAGMLLFTEQTKVSPRSTKS